MYWSLDPHPNTRAPYLVEPIPRGQEVRKSFSSRTCVRERSTHNTRRKPGKISMGVVVLTPGIPGLVITSQIFPPLSLPLLFICTAVSSMFFILSRPCILSSILLVGVRSLFLEGRGGISVAVGLDEVWCGGVLYLPS